MKKVNKIIALGIISSLFFAACEKTDNGPSLTPQEQILTSRIWKVDSLTVPQLNDPTKDSSITTACSDSALMAFDVYKAYQLADASKGCDSVAIPYDMGTWKFSVGGDSLLLHGNRDFVWKIQVLNDTLVKATFHDSIAPDKNWIKTITLK